MVVACSRHAHPQTTRATPPQSKPCLRASPSSSSFRCATGDSLPSIACAGRLLFFILVNNRLSFTEAAPES